MKMIQLPKPEEIRALRERMGWTQNDVATLLHLSSAQMVSRWESGARSMGMALWELLCIKASDQKFQIRKRREEIERHMHSRVWVAELLNQAKK